MGKNNYFELVLYITSKIPHGRVSTYGAIADYLSLGSARMVGWALTNYNQDNFTYDIPAHRVVNRNGELTGRIHFKPPLSMQERLEKEEIFVKNHKVQNFKNHFWHPRELDDIQESLNND